MIVKRWIGIFDLKNQNHCLWVAKTCVDQSQILWKRWRQLAIGAWTDLWWGELSSNLPASGIGHFIRQNQTPLLLTSYIHPPNCSSLRSSTQLLSKNKQLFCTQYRKGKHLSAKKLLFHVAMVNISQRPAITLFCFMLCLIYKAEWLVAKIFPEILEHVPAFVHLRLYLRPAWLIVTNQPSKCHIAV